MSNRHVRFAFVDPFELAARHDWRLALGVADGAALRAAAATVARERSAGARGVGAGLSTGRHRRGSFVEDASAARPGGGS